MSTYAAMTAMRNAKSLSGATTKMEKAAAILPLVIQAYKVGKHFHDKYKNRKNRDNCTLSFQEGTWFYPFIVEHLLSLSDEMPNHLDANIQQYYNQKKGEYEHDIKMLATVGFAFDFDLEGYTYRAFFNQESSSDVETVMNVIKKRSFQILAPNAKAFKALSEYTTTFHDGIVRDKLSREVRVNKENFALYTGGMWDCTERPIRPLSSVVLKDGQLERIKSDLEKFMSSNEAYVERGIPWRRGYLLWGEPGTGKSSIIQALANHFDMRMYYLSLHDITSDSQLIKAISDIKGKSMLLLEDVDVFGAVQARDENAPVTESSKASLSALLNALDGPAAPHGLVTFMTTNHKSKLDPALIRKGRVDLEEHISLPDYDQVDRLWSLFYDDPMEIENIPEGKSTSFYYNVFKTNLDDPESARKEIIDAWKEVTH